MTVRAAEPGDAPALGRIHTASWRAAYVGIMPDSVLAKLSATESEARWCSRLSQSPHGTFVIEEDGGVLGFATAVPSRDGDAPEGTAELLAIYLDPTAWHRGLGRSLWEDVLRSLQHEGFTEVTVWVLEANALARAFYERTGFTLEPAVTKTADGSCAGLSLVRYRLRIT